MKENHTFQLSEVLFFFLHNRIGQQQCPWRSGTKRRKKEAAAFLLVTNEGRDTEDTLRKAVPQKGTWKEIYQMWTDYDEKSLLHHGIYLLMQEIAWDRPHLCDESLSGIGHEEGFVVLLKQEATILTFRDYPSSGVTLKEPRHCKLPAQ